MKIIIASLVTVLFLGALATTGAAQNDPATITTNQVIRKVYVRHADPQLIWRIMAGQTTFLTPPELSVCRGGGFTTGLGGGTSRSGLGGFGGFGGGGLGQQRG